MGGLCFELVRRGIDGLLEMPRFIGVLDKTSANRVGILSVMSSWLVSRRLKKDAARRGRIEGV